jgi:L-asparagine transporter-like permease
MDIYTIALFLHILGALGIAFANGLEFMIVRGLRRGSSEQTPAWVDAYRILPALGGGSLGLILVTGLYMTAVRGAEPRTFVSLAAVVLIGALGAWSGIRLRNAVRAAAARPDSSDAQLALREWRFPVSNRLRIALLIGLLAIMVFKPDLVGSIVAIVVAIALGALWCIPVQGRTSRASPGTASRSQS